jgi:hypothetical protein
MQSLDMDDIVAGDVIYGSGADTLARLAKGSNDQVLTLASGVPSWADAGGGGGTSIADADADTKIQVEESSDEDIIRFDVAGTQVATMTADGLLFGTDTAATNALHDYEEGTFTGGLSSASGSITVHSSYDQLAYTKIGRFVHICGTLEMDSVSSPGGALTLTGLPYTAASSGNGAPERSARTGSFFWAGGLVSGEPDWFLQVTENGTTVRLTYGAGGTGSGGASPAAQIDSGSFLQFDFSYIAAT